MEQIWDESDIGSDCLDMGEFRPEHKLVKSHRRFLLFCFFLKKKMKNNLTDKYNFTNVKCMISNEMFTRIYVHYNLC